MYNSNSFFRYEEDGMPRVTPVAGFWDSEEDDKYFAEEPEPEFRRLDKRLSAALERAAHGELGRAVTDHASKCLKTYDRPAYGRELLRMIVRSYQTHATAKTSTTSQTWAWL